MSAALKTVGGNKPSKKTGSYISEPFPIDVASLIKRRPGPKAKANFGFHMLVVGVARETDYSVATVVKARKAEAPELPIKVWTDGGTGKTRYALVPAVAPSATAGDNAQQ